MQGGACKEEHVDLTEYRDFADALQQIGHFLEQVYQFKRIHSSLGYLTPSEFEAGWLNEPDASRLNERVNQKTASTAKV